MCCATSTTNPALYLFLSLPCCFGDHSLLARAAEREADPELAALCRRRDSDPPAPEPPNQSPLKSLGGGDGGWGSACCDAVLSNDSDFLVVDVPG